MPSFVSTESLCMYYELIMSCSCVNSIVFLYKDGLYIANRKTFVIMSKTIIFLNFETFA